MSEFRNLRCISLTGVEAPITHSHPDNPYGKDWDKSQVARAVRQSRVKKIQWEFENVLRTVEFDDIESAALDPNTDLLIVTLHYNDSTYTRPCNAVVINPNGTINHQVTPPKYVDIAPPHSQAGKHLVENIDSVTIQNKRVLFKLSFRHEWVERRYYNVAITTWEERDYIYRA